MPRRPGPPAARRARRSAAARRLCHGCHFKAALNSTPAQHERGRVSRHEHDGGTASDGDGDDRRAHEQEVQRIPGAILVRHPGRHRESFPAPGHARVVGIEPEHAVDATHHLLEPAIQAPRSAWPAAARRCGRPSTRWKRAAASRRRIRSRCRLAGRTGSRTRRRSGNTGRRSRRPPRGGSPRRRARPSRAPRAVPTYTTISATNGVPNRYAVGFVRIARPSAPPTRGTLKPAR